MAVSHGVATIAVTMIRSLDAVPVDGDDDRVISAFRRSMELLRAGRRLLIFPEDPKQPADPATGMRPFKAGAALLSRLYQESVGMPLPIYPLAISERRRLVVVGAPLYGEEGPARRASVGRLREGLYRRVGEMVAELDRERIGRDKMS
jgi:1-acyl-sn-glycerol-3-phosphate acyltransferase